MALPNIKTLSKLPRERIAEILDILFEPSTDLHRLSVSTLTNNVFPDYESMVASVKAQLFELCRSQATEDKDLLEAILASHPRLGEKKVDSEQSRQEQKQLQGSEEEADRLKQLNADYEKTFQGLRYV